MHINTSRPAVVSEFARVICNHLTVHSNIDSKYRQKEKVASNRSMTGDMEDDATCYMLSGICYQLSVGFLSSAITVADFHW